MQWPSEVLTGIPRACANAIALLRLASNNPTAADLALQMPAIFNGLETVINIPTSALNSGTMIVYDQTNHEIVVVGLGTQDVRNFQACLDYWPVVPQRSAIYAQPYAAAADVINLQIPAPTGGRWVKMVMVGHSYGGATTAILGKKLEDAYGISAGYIYNFGSPLYVLAPNIRQYDNWIARRIFFNNDPVPNLPPQLETIGAMIPLFDNDAIRAFNIFRPGAGGLRINEETQRLDPQDFPRDLSIPTQMISLGAWIASQFGFGATDHEFRQYDIAISNLAAANWQPDLSIPNVVRARTSPTTTEINAQRDIAIGQNSIVTQSNPTAAATVGLANIVPVPGLRFYGRRIGRDRVVLYNQLIVLYCRTRRTQRAIVRYLNRQLAGV